VRAGNGDPIPDSSRKPHYGVYESCIPSYKEIFILFSLDFLPYEEGRRVKK
jgi:hypothetical protein